jgi:nitroreductase
MEIEKAIKTRRSIRKWKDKKVPEPIIKKIINMARYAPSSMNSQPWEFVVIKDKKIIEKMIKPRENGDGEEMHPPMMIAVCVDRKRSHNRWIEDGSVAAQNLLLAAHAFGLGAVWLTAYKHPIQLRKSKVERIIVRELKMPRFIRPVCLIALGYSNERPKKKRLRALEHMIHYNRFGYYKKKR